MAQYIRNSKGFTLIELMATLAVLALIVIIAVLAIGNIMDDAEASAETSSIKMIEKAGAMADVAGLDHDRIGVYDISTLIEHGYLDMDNDNDLVKGHVTKTGDGNRYVYNGGVEPEAAPESDFYAITGAELAKMSGLDSFEDLDQSNQERFDNNPNGVGIVKYLGADEHVVIPDTIGGNPVVLLSEGLFINGVESDILSVYVPDHVVFAGYNAFGHNSYGSTTPDTIEHVNAPSTMDYDPNDAFFESSYVTWR